MDTSEVENSYSDNQEHATPGTVSSLPLFEYFQAPKPLYTCDCCGQGFKQESKFKAHIVLHDEKRVYRCDFCEKIFSKSSNLTSHLLIHTGMLINAVSVTLVLFAPSF